MRAKSIGLLLACAFSFFDLQLLLASPPGRKSGTDCPTDNQNPPAAVTNLNSHLKEIFSVKKFPSQCGPDKLLEIARKELSEEKFKVFSNLYESLFFFDLNHIAFHNAMEANQKPSEPFEFNVYGQFPFDGYFAAKNYLKDKDPLSIETLKGVHKNLLSKESISQEHIEELKHHLSGWVPANSQGITDDQLGQIRSHCIWINNPALVNQLAKQPSSEQSIQLADGTYLDPGKKLSALDGVKANSFLEVGPEPFLNRFDKGPKPRFVTYPCVNSAKQLDHFIRKNPDVLKPEQVQELKDLTKKDTSPYLSTANQKFTEHLVSNQFEKLGNELSKPTLTRDQAIEAVGRFYWNLVSIHPFAEGNGRTSRKITQEILMQLGINPPIYKNWGEDIFLRQESFVKIFKEAIATSDQIHEQACDKFDGIQSLDFRPFFGDAKKPIRLNEFFKWAKDNKMDLKYPWRGDFNDEDAKTLVSQTMGLYKDHLDGKPVDLSKFKETKLDPVVTMLAREARLIQEVAKPVPDRLRVGLTWQGKNMAESYLQYGQPESQLQQESDNDPTATFAGFGTYISGNVYDSSSYAKDGGSLLAVEIPRNEKVVDLRDPEVLGKLYRNGIDELTIYHNPGALVGYHATGNVNKEWYVYKKPLDPSRFRQAQWTDFKLSELNLMRERTEPVYAPAAVAQMDKFISEAKAHYKSKVLPSLSEKLLWSPFGECLEKENSTYNSVDKQKCIAQVGVTYKIDPYLEKCCMFSIPEGIFIERAAPDQCAGQTFTSIRKKEPSVETLLPSGTPRTEEDKKLLETNHLQANRDKKGNILSYSVLTQDQYLNLSLKTFKKLEEAQEYLYRIPHPINLERYAERLERNQKLFENNLKTYLYRLGDARPPETIFEWRWAGSNLDKHNLNEMVKEELFKSVKASPGGYLGRYVTNFTPKVTIDVNMIDQADLDTFVQAASTPQYQLPYPKPFPGFVLKLQKDPLSDRMLPAVSEGTQKSREQGQTIVRGYQNGIPIRMRVRYMESTPAGYAKMIDPNDKSGTAQDRTSRQDLNVRQKNQHKFSGEVLKELKDKAEKKNKP
jgi:hypothetical protein